MKAIGQNPLAVALAATLLYIAYAGGTLLGGTDVRQFIVLGRAFVTQSRVSSVIHLDPKARIYTRTGYDGQFSYYIAVDPSHAYAYTDRSSLGRQAPAYRYDRILYPLLARLLALGQVALVPYTLLLINILAVGLVVGVLGAWLSRSACSPRPALLFAIYPGTIVSVTRDLSDLLSLAFVALAVYLFRYGGERRYLWTAGIFALAGLTRETTLVVAAAYAVWTMREQNVRAGLVFGVIAAAPLLLWKMWLYYWLGTFGLPAANAPVLPLAGWVGQTGPNVVMQGVSVVAPGIIAAGLACALLRSRVRTAEVAAMLLNVLLFVVLLNPFSYGDINGSARAAAGVPLFLIFCLPSTRRVVRGGIGWWRVARLLWTFPLMVPWFFAAGSRVGWIASWLWLCAALAGVAALLRTVVNLVRGRAASGGAVESRT